MKITLVEMHKNGRLLAERLVEDSHRVTEVVLMSDSTVTSPAALSQIRALPLPSSSLDPVSLVANTGADLVVNFNSLHGFNGLVEGLRKGGSTVIGSGRRFSSTEIDKRSFKEWMIAEGFPTPQVLCVEPMEGLRRRARTLPYPVAVKPDKQSGPDVRVCRNQADLTTYLDESVRKAPVSAFATMFVVEQYVEIREHVHVGYVVAGGRAVVTSAVRLPFDRAIGRASGRCMCVLLRYPHDHPHRAVIRRLVERMPEFGDAVIGSVQCAVTSDGRFYFMEHNARPGTNGAVRMMADPLGVLIAMRDGDPTAIERQVLAMENTVAVGIALFHGPDRIPVDVARLKALEGCRFHPHSIVEAHGEHFSVAGSTPSMLTVQGDNSHELILRLRQLLPAISSAGPFFPIDTDSVQKMLDS